MAQRKQVPLKKCSGCREPKPATRDEFYADKRTPTGLQSRCKCCEKARVAVYQRSGEGQLTKRRRQILLERAREALRSGELGRVYTCELADQHCKGRIEGHHPDGGEPLEVVWLCTGHHRLVERLPRPPTYEQLKALADSARESAAGKETG